MKTYEEYMVECVRRADERRGLVFEIAGAADTLAHDLLDYEKVGAIERLPDGLRASAQSVVDKNKQLSDLFEQAQDAAKEFAEQENARKADTPC
jgi:murein tripeptide amidase MpaA